MECHPCLGGERPPPAPPVNVAYMDKPYLYEIRVEGQVTGRWSDWFEGLTIIHDRNGETRFAGRLIDQAALYGVLIKVHDLNMILISVRRLPDEEPGASEDS